MADGGATGADAPEAFPAAGTTTTTTTTTTRPGEEDEIDDVVLTTIEIDDEPQTQPGRGGGDNDDEEAPQAVPPPWRAAALLRRAESKIARSTGYFVMVGGLAWGLDLGAVSGALPGMKGSFGLSKREVGTFVALAAPGEVVGAVCAGFVADAFGRKWCLTLCDLFFAASALGLASAQTTSELYAWRFAAGAAAGAAVVAQVSWASEIAPKRRRGFAIACFEVAISVGYTTSFLVYTLCVHYDVAFAWRLLFAIPAVPAIIQLSALPMAPETPAWLFANNGDQTKGLAVARDIYAKFGGIWSSPMGVPTLAEAEVVVDRGARGLLPASSIASQQQVEPTTLAPTAPVEEEANCSTPPEKKQQQKDDEVRRRGPGGWSAVRREGSSSLITTAGEENNRDDPSRSPEDTASKTNATKQQPKQTSQVEPSPPSTWRVVWEWRGNFALMTLMTMLTFFTGGFNLRVYAVEIFENAGAAAEPASQAVVALGFVKLVSTIVGLWRVDVDGRKKLLLTSLAGMACAAAFFSAVFGLIKTPSSLAFGLIATAALFYTAFFQIGFGTCNFVLAGEVFPPELKGRLTCALKLPTAVFQATSQYVFYLALTPASRFVLLFLVQAFIGLVGWVLLRGAMVETKQSDADDVRRRLKETPFAACLAAFCCFCCLSSSSSPSSEKALPPPREVPASTKDDVKEDPEDDESASEHASASSSSPPPSETKQRKKSAPKAAKIASSTRSLVELVQPRRKRGGSDQTSGKNNAQTRGDLVSRQDSDVTGGQALV